MTNDPIENINNNLKERVNNEIYEVVKRILNESSGPHKNPLAKGAVPKASTK